MFGFTENPAAYPPAPVLHPADGDLVNQITFQNWLAALTNRTANLFQNTSGVRSIALSGTNNNVKEQILRVSGTVSSVSPPTTTINLADCAIGQFKLVIFTGARISGGSTSFVFKNHLGTQVATWSPHVNCQMNGVGVLLKTSATAWSFYASGIGYSGVYATSIAGSSGVSTQTVNGPGDLLLDNSDAPINTGGAHITIDPPLGPFVTKRIYLEKQSKAASLGLLTPDAVTNVQLSWWRRGADWTCLTLVPNGLLTRWVLANHSQRESLDEILELTTYPGSSSVLVGDYDFVNAQFIVANLEALNVELPNSAPEGREVTIRVRGLAVGGQAALRRTTGIISSHFASGFARDNVIMGAKFINGTWRTTHNSSMPIGSIASYDGVPENS